MEAVEFYLEESPFLGFIFIFLYIFPLCALFLVTIPIIVKILLIMVVLYFFQKNWKLHVSRKRAHSIIKVWQDSHGCFGFETRKGLGSKARLLSDTYISRFIIILRFRTKLKTYNILIPFDCLSRNEYRILSCRLLFF